MVVDFPFLVEAVLFVVMIDLPSLLALLAGATLLWRVGEGQWGGGWTFLHVRQHHANWHVKHRRLWG